MYEAAFKNIDDTLWKDAGCSSELDYIEQTSWILFLKYLDDYQTDKANSALLNGEVYNSILSDEFSWATWATPKSSDGKLDYNAALTGDDLREFVNFKLFPYLKQFKVSADSANTLEYKIGEIFSEISNKIQSGYALRDFVEYVLRNYVDVGVDELDVSKLSTLLTAKYGSIHAAQQQLGTPQEIQQTFIEFQKNLYKEAV